MGILAAPREAASTQSLAARLNWLRAGVLGANDGIVSTAGLVFGVAGATTDHTTLLIAGLAGMVAGSLSMAGGEYVSVSSQRDTEVAALAGHQARSAADPQAARRDLIDYYVGQGVSQRTAEALAEELGNQAAEHHALTSLGVDVAEPVSPWAAARASLVAFLIGAVIPLVAIVLAPDQVRLSATLGAVWLALGLTGFLSARLGGAAATRPVLRNLIVGTLTMTLTYLVGLLVGGQIG